MITFSLFSNKPRKNLIINWTKIKGTFFMFATILLKYYYASQYSRRKVWTIRKLLNTYQWHGRICNLYLSKIKASIFILPSRYKYFSLYIQIFLVLCLMDMTIKFPIWLSIVNTSVFLFWLLRKQLTGWKLNNKQIKIEFN